MCGRRPSELAPQRTRGNTAAPPRSVRQRCVPGDRGSSYSYTSVAFLHQSNQDGTPLSRDSTLNSVSAQHRSASMQEPDAAWAVPAVSRLLEYYSNSCSTSIWQSREPGGRRQRGEADLVCRNKYPSQLQGSCGEWLALAYLYVSLERSALLSAARTGRNATGRCCTAEGVLTTLPGCAALLLWAARAARARSPGS